VCVKASRKLHTNERRETKVWYLTNLQISSDGRVVSSHCVRTRSFHSFSETSSQVEDESLQPSFYASHHPMTGNPRPQQAVQIWHGTETRAGRAGPSLTPSELQISDRPLWPCPCVVTTGQTKIPPCHLQGFPQ